MPDLEWLKQLVNAEVRNGRLVPADPAAVQTLAAERLSNIIPDLLLEAQDACTIFNDLRLEARANSQDTRYAHTDGDLRALPLAQPNNAAHGLVLLLGRCQIALEQKGGFLEATVSRVVGYRHEKKRLYSFKPQVDAFGTLVWAWSADAEVMMSPEMLVKKLLEDLLLAVFHLKTEESP